ncbi:DNA repair protein BRCA2 [Trypanosoma cruzi Dm28c]|uniref:DNA repair protein BRCA2 n=2 Tax=Trypanosoma cruzi TaxID=5693 RepID=V5BQX8_TRYCR|nr:DNA repair protein BRCA2 [Trypanosoma cruzi Dm28c]PWU95349.1 putative DNA repair protein BRCA2 [Trypanosoma cruzi]
MGLEPDNVCAHCTFINAPGRVRCSVCFRNIRKRIREGAEEIGSELHLPHLSVSNQSEKQQEGCVATLFSTASGQPVVVSEKSLQAARERLDADDAQIPLTHGNGDAAVATLFSTASGQPVVVSEKSLQAARDRIDADNCATPCDKECSARGISNSSSAASPSFVGPRRGCFVVPFARSPHLRQVEPPNRFQDAPARREMRSLSFDIFACFSLPMSSLPSSLEVVQSTFAFNCVGCSPELLLLLGLSAEDDSVSSRSFHTALVRLGACTSSCSENWCQQMLKSTLLKLRGLSLCCSPPLPVFSVSHALLYLCFKYNREFVDGVRPALRVLTEGDVPASSLLVVSVVCLSLEERLAPHTSVGVISDGCYEIKVALDVPLTNLVREGILRRGHKLLVCGAKMLLKNFCSPVDCRDDVVLSINYNCTRPVDPTAALGFYQTNPPVVSSAAVHPLGGLVPSIRGVVERILPPIFVEQVVGKGDTVSTGAKVVRNIIAQLKRLEGVLREAAVPSESTNTRRLVRLTSLVLTCEQKEDVMVQLWEDCAEGCGAESLEEDCGSEFPSEGSSVLIFALTPSRSRPSHPFQHAKVLYTRARLDYRVISSPSGFVRPLRCSISDADLSMPAGAATDFAGLFLASAKNEAVNSFVIVMLNNEEAETPSFCIMDVPCATPVKEITITMPVASFTPVIVQNSSFIRFAVDDLGPDCLHVLANEFTKVLQRPASSYLRTVISSLELVREKAMGRKSLMARAEEILRLRQLSVEARTDVRRYLGELNGRDVPLAVASGSTSRLPYYMRAERKGPISKGVVIPTPHAKSEMTEEQKSVFPPSPAIHHGERSHIFGNIIEMRLIRVFDSGRRESVLLPIGLAASDVSTAGSVVPQETLLYDSICFDLVIQVGAVAEQQVRATMKSPAVLSGMLEQRLAMRSVCAMAVDEGQVEYFMQRTKILETWQRAPEESWWWFLSLSHVVAGGSHPPETEGTALLWLESEWRTLIDMLCEGLRDSLFKFSVDAAGEVTRAVFLKENCSLRELMKE